MMSFAWRWAQVGDRVEVHHHEAPHPLMPGVVTRVRCVPHGTNVAIRLDGESSVQRFARQFVHSDPKDPAERCPLCSAHVESGDGATPDPGRSGRSAL